MGTPKVQLYSAALRKWQVAGSSPVRSATFHVFIFTIVKSGFIPRYFFSLSAFAERVNGIADTDVSVRSICEQSVEDCMTPTQFLGPDFYIDTTVDWGNVDYVIVGSREEPIGILTITDVWAKQSTA